MFGREVNADPCWRMSFYHFLIICEHSFFEKTMPLNVVSALRGIVYGLFLLYSSIDKKRLEFRHKILHKDIKLDKAGHSKKWALLKFC